MDLDPEKFAGEGLTFDDVLMVPAYSEVMPREVDIQSKFSRNIEIRVPVVSAAMDTVTEARAAICLAQSGGLGVIHRNMTPAEQAEQVSTVKKYESGIIKDPVCVPSSATVGEVVALIREKNFSGVPVLDEGGRLTGIVTSRDIRFEDRFAQAVTAAMTPRERLVAAPEKATREDIRGLLHEHRIEKVLLVDEAFNLKGLVTVKDIQKQTEFPDACKDDEGRLRVAAAVGTGGDSAERCESGRGRS